MTQVPAPNHRQLAATALTSGRGRGLVCLAAAAFAVAYGVWLIALSEPVTRWQMLAALAMIIILAVGNIAADQVIRIIAAGFLREAVDRAAAQAVAEGSIRPPGNGGTG